MYILVVDDDKFENELVQFVLRREGYEVATIDNPEGALQIICKREPDLLILDVMMPHIDGFRLAAQLRSDGYETPIIFMTAQDAIESKLEGFRTGGDDYICKPFNHQELVARIQAVIRRSKKNGHVGNSSIRSGQFELFPAELKVVLPGRPAILLTHKEMQVLRALMVSAGQVVDRNQLLFQVWNDDESTSNLVDVYIRRLRLKLEKCANDPQHIVSVRGIGYKFLGK